MKNLLLLALIASFATPTLFANTIIVFKCSESTKTIGNEGKESYKAKALLVIEIAEDGEIVDASTTRYGQDDGGKYQSTDDAELVLGAIADDGRKETILLEHHDGYSMGTLRARNVGLAQKVDVPSSLKKVGVTNDDTTITTVKGSYRIWSSATKYANGDLEGNFDAAVAGIEEYLDNKGYHAR
jgi:hypothetical protein